MGGILVGTRRSLGEEIIVNKWLNGAVISRLKLGGGEEIRSKIEEGREKSEAIVIMGDFNVKIGELEAGDGEDMVVRRSRDTKVNRDGSKLVEFCDEEGLVVTNGAIKGHWERAITFVGNQYESVESVLDLVLHEGDPNVLDEVNIWPATDSDHLGVTVTLLGPGVPKAGIDGDAGGELQGAEGPAAGGIKLAVVLEAAGETGMTRSLKRRKKRDEFAWLGEEYKLQRARVNKALRKYLRRYGEAERTCFREERGKLKKMAKARLKEIAEEKKNRVKASKNLGELWEALGACRARAGRKGENITKEKWAGQISMVQGGSGGGRDEDRDGTLNALKNKKAAEEDGITEEYLKHLPENWRKELWEVIQECWKSSRLREGWTVARIFPIYKGEGMKMTRATTGGVSLLDLGYKLFASIMANRLSAYLEREGKLNESQGGFREKRGTREQIFILNTMIGNWIKHKGGKLYTAFIGLKAAFDTVDRALLLEKLWRGGIRARFYDMVKTIYRTSENEVITGAGLTQRFPTESGVSQGCPLSPILFNLFIDDIDAEWVKRGLGARW
ncbi:uncharacterized protein LOC135171220 [Diachasmimorpha longicaudata]|uniref:uncharacterized protein LOC135171220 n=1 Tax=Diachasmimorpha longicaudata TaxID=58733 RepID=UPI0030B8F10F